MKLLVIFFGFLLVSSASARFNYEQFLDDNSNPSIRRFTTETVRINNELAGEMVGIIRDLAERVLQSLVNVAGNGQYHEYFGQKRIIIRQGLEKLNNVSPGFGKEWMELMEGTVRDMSISSSVQEDINKQHQEYQQLANLELLQELIMLVYDCIDRAEYKISGAYEANQSVEQRRDQAINAANDSLTELNEAIESALDNFSELTLDPWQKLLGVF